MVHGEDEPNMFFREVSAWGMVKSDEVSQSEAELLDRATRFAATLRCLNDSNNVIG